MGKWPLFPCFHATDTLQYRVSYTINPLTRKSVIRFVWYDVICRPFLELKVKVPYRDNQFPFKDSENFISVGSISMPHILHSETPCGSRSPPTPQDHLYTVCTKT